MTFCLKALNLFQRAWLSVHQSNKAILIETVEATVLIFPNRVCANMLALWGGGTKHEKIDVFLALWFFKNMDFEVVLF